MRPALLLALLLAALPAPARAAAQSLLIQKQLSALSFHQHPGAKLPLDTELVDESGKPVRLDSFFGKAPVVLVLYYLRCRSLCGFVLGDLASTLRKVPLDSGKDYRVVAISFDRRDKPADSRAARAKFLARDPDGKGWHFLTGSPAAVRRIADTVGFPYVYDASAGQYAHPAGLTIVSPDGRVARYILGVTFLPIDLRLALTEAAKGRISTPVTDLLLLCYCYDPSTGRYSAQINNIMRLLGGATVVGLAGTMVTLSRRRGRK